MMTIDDIKQFLNDKGWLETRPRVGVTRYTSPGELQVTPPITFDIADSAPDTDGDHQAVYILQTLADLYDLPVSDIGHLLQPIINCNTHIYNTNHIPPYLFKTIIPTPYYIYFSFFFYKVLYNFSFRMERAIRFQNHIVRLKKRWYHIRLWWYRFGGPFYPLITVLAIIQFYFLFADPYVPGVTSKMTNFLRPLFFIPPTVPGKILFIIFVLLYFGDLRNFILINLRRIFVFLKSFQGKRFKKVSAYLNNAVWFSFANSQNTLLRVLTEQYPQDTGFVIHAIDLEFMQAGKPRVSYIKQLEELSIIHEKKFRAKIFPFLSVDPRRIEKDESFLRFGSADNSVILAPCAVKKYIEERRFSGFTLTPAMGYYPFDENLLPAWRYAAQNKIPIYVNCNDDALYYRGKKKKEWDFHPLFGSEEYKNDSVIEMDDEIDEKQTKLTPLFLYQVENSEFTRNFMHPLNYLCLLYEPFLREIVGKAKSPYVRDIFGYTNEYTPMKSDLTDIKLCFSHFGGAEEWEKFIRYDRDRHSSNQLLRQPGVGVNFFGRYGGINHAKLKNLWTESDWYTIICSLMLQYKNVYADISNLSNKPHLSPLFKMTMQNPRLRSKVLFGTDFYMVHRHTSERSVLSEIAEHVTLREMELISRINPRNYLGVI